VVVILSKRIIIYLSTCSMCRRGPLTELRTNNGPKFEVSAHHVGRPNLDGWHLMDKVVQLPVGMMDDRNSIVIKSAYVRPRALEFHPRYKRNNQLANTRTWIERQMESNFKHVFVKRKHPS